MEGIFLLLVFFFYILLRLAFGMRKDVMERDRIRHAEGLAMMRRREFDLALAYFTDALELFPRSVVLLEARGRCQFELKEYLHALADCSRAISLEAHLPESYLIKGKSLLKMDNAEEALIEFDKAVWHGRQNSEPLCWRGIAYERLGQIERAETDFLAAKKMGDENAAFYLHKRDGIKLIHGN
jgi:tetratricopeptide (TPR) repeat protein